jgi:hypothetical protein
MLPHKTTLYELINPFAVNDKVDEDIKKYNRADTVNMTPDEMNKFRHIAASAVLTSKYYKEPYVNLLGHGKEFVDKIIGKDQSDIDFDKANNRKGREIGLANRNIKGTEKNLYDYIFKTEIEPYRK